MFFYAYLLDLEDKLELLTLLIRRAKFLKSGYIID
jgi:hypothetical protein